MRSIREIKFGENRLWNCLGTYYQMILEGNDYCNEWLSIFQGYKVRYKKLEVDQLIEKYGKNPWGYQPIEFYGSELFDFQKAIGNYFNHANILLKIKKCEEVTPLKTLIGDCLEQGNYLIINADEYYLKYMQEYYGSIHNKHFLLIEEVQDGCVTVLDTEVGTTVKILFEDLERAAYSTAYHNMELYIIELPERKVSLNITFDVKEEMEKALDSMYWYEDFFYDLNSRLASENRNYYLQGISFAISFKIVPYLQWLMYLTISDTGRSGESVLTALKNHIIDWKKIRYILMMEVRRHSEKNQRAIVNINKKIIRDGENMMELVKEKEQ